MENLSYFIENISKNEPTQIKLLERDISGGRISKETIDTLSGIFDKNILTISGLTQNTFEYLLHKYGSKFRVINFWKCPLVQDFSAIEGLSEIEYITYFWNQRVEKLWDFRKTPKLKGFSFDDFTRLHTLDDLKNADQLVELEFGDKVWAKYEVESLAPLAHLKNLKRLHFSAKKIRDERIEPLASLESLEYIGFPTRLFTTEQIAWLKSKLSPTIESKTMNAFWTIERPLEISGKRKNTFICGKRKPFLDSVIDKDRIAKYVKEFDQRVTFYSENPEKRPEDFTR